MNERAEHEQVVYEEIETLRTALFDHSLAGIRRTGEVYPLGAFLLIGAMIDMLAGLRYAPKSDRDGKQGSRYADFVHEFFPPEYGRLQLGSRLWRGLRCRPLHNFSTDDVALADSQSAGLHLQNETSGRVLLHWPEFLADYAVALTSYWTALDCDPAVRRNALIRCQRFPPMMVTEVAFISPPFLTQSFSVQMIAGASAWGGR
jgi:hypothetical protein